MRETRETRAVAQDADRPLPRGVDIARVRDVAMHASMTRRRAVAFNDRPIRAARLRFVGREAVKIGVRGKPNGQRRPTRREASNRGSYRA